MADRELAGGESVEMALRAAAHKSAMLEAMLDAISEAGRWPETVVPDPVHAASGMAEACADIWQAVDAVMRTLPSAALNMPLEEAGVGEEGSGE